MHLYLHVPFCARRCSYCDFAIAVRKRIPSRAYADAVLREWQQWQERAGGRMGGGTDAGPPIDPTLDTLYFGGGTPSLLEPDELARIVEGLTSRHPLAPGAEVTLEANPDDITPARAAAWRRAGIGRVSLGVQSFDPAVLTWMHRTHRAEQVAPAVEALRGAGIGQVSLDLIFAMPAEVPRDWARDLERALALAPDHLSLYGLTVEDHTPLARWVSRRQVRAAEDDRYAAEFLAAHAALSAAGFEHYEVSNYALPGRRARHNSAYWRRAIYIGLGPSAHSAFERERRWNVREWAEYERALSAGESVVGGREMLDDTALRLEELYLGLRTADGLPADRLPAPVVASWVDAGWAEVFSGAPAPSPSGQPHPPTPSPLRERGSGSRVRLTPEGWLRLDALVGMV